MRAYKLGKSPQVPLCEVYALHTVGEPRQGLARFLNGFGRHLGKAAMIKTVDDAHLTVVESRTTHALFWDMGYKPGQARDCRNRLEQYLGSTVSCGPMPVNVDAKQPLIWMAGRATLALRVVMNEQLAQEREEAVEFLTAEFGKMPPKELPFIPHITIGSIDRPVTGLERSRPITLLPPGLQIPETIMLNGLKVYPEEFRAEARVS